MNRDRFEGGIRSLRGRAKTAVGAVGGSPRPQVEGAFDQAAGAAQHAYGRARETARTLAHDGEHLLDEAASRGRHYRGRAEHHGRHIARRADENRGTTLALVAFAAFGLGWLASRGR